MASNIEIKAVVDDREALAQRAAAIATDGPWHIFQRDTFFHCARQRLKLRDFGDATGELICYERGDAQGPALSTYQRSATADPNGLARVLAVANGVRAQVVKTRTLFMAGRTRIHFDVVEGLGDFMELEVVLGHDESPARGTAEAERLMAVLEIPDAARIERAYIDLLEAR